MDVKTMKKRTIRTEKEICGFLNETKKLIQKNPSMSLSTHLSVCINGPRIFEALRAFGIIINESKSKQRNSYRWKWTKQSDFTIEETTKLLKSAKERFNNTRNVARKTKQKQNANKILVLELSLRLIKLGELKEANNLLKELE